MEDGLFVLERPRASRPVQAVGLLMLVAALCLTGVAWARAAGYRSWITRFRQVTWFDEGGRKIKDGGKLPQGVGKQAWWRAGRSGAGWPCPRASA